MPWVVYPSKNVILCLFCASEQAKVLKKSTKCEYHLSWPLNFCPQTPVRGRGGRVRGGDGGKAAVATTQSQNQVAEKMRPFIHRLSVSQISERFLPEIKNVEFCNLILKSVLKLKSA